MIEIVSIAYRSHSPGIPGKPGIWPKKTPCMEKSWNFKKGRFHRKIMEFCFSYQHFFNIRINIAQFILRHLCFLLNLIFDYWWLHVPKSFDVQTI